MEIQHINATDAERAYVSFSNYDGSTISAYHPVYLFTSGGNSASVDGNAAGQAATAVGDGACGSFLGLTHKDVGQGAGRVGTAIAYGYIASALIYAAGTSVTIDSGEAFGPVSTDVGLGIGGLSDNLGPVVNLNDGLSATAGGGGAALGSPGGYLNHAFVRNL